MKRVNLVTLGVRDLIKSERFYREVFGWTRFNPVEQDVAFLNMGGWVLALFGWDDLAKDAKVGAEGSGFRGVSLAHNPREKHEVAALIEKACASGATLVKAAEDVFWGGYSGYFKDPDGHLWEVAWNPYLPAKEDGFLDI